MSNLSIELLANLSYEEQVRVLETLSRIDDLLPIEINGKKFYIPQEVVGLIDSLWAQLGNSEPFPQSG